MTSGSGPQQRVFRLPRSAYIAVLFLFFGTTPFAFKDVAISYDANGNPHNGALPVGWQTLTLLVPVLVGVFIWRWATIIDASGITIRAAFGKRSLRWDDIRGVSVDGRSVYAVTSDGAWRLPCVHVAHLGVLTRASGGRLPEVDDPTPKYAPQRRRR